MATLLERARLIEEMFSVVYKWMGGINGGLAAATILASTILAAMVGVIGAAVVTMGIIALPAMLKRNYDQKQASLRSRERFWDIRVPKIDSIFDNSLVPRPSWSPGVPPQHRKLVAATHRSPI